MVDGGFTETDKLLICLALILLLTIVWTILIGIMYKMNERKYVETKSKLFIDDDDDEDTIVYKEKKKVNKADLETYVKVRFYRTKKIITYIAPKKVELKEGQKIKIRVDKDTVKSAIVTKGNYTREKYKNNNYKELNIVND